VTVTVQNSFGTNMSTSTQHYSTFEEKPDISNSITGFSVSPTSSSLLVSWSDPSNVCGEITGYSVLIGSNKVIKCVLCAMLSTVASSDY